MTFRYAERSPFVGLVTAYHIDIVGGIVKLGYTTLLAEYKSVTNPHLVSGTPTASSRWLVVSSPIVKVTCQCAVFLGNKRWHIVNGVLIV